MNRLVAFLLVAVVVCCGCNSEPTDEDLLEKFIEEVTGPVDDALVQRSLGYTAMAELPLDVKVPQHAGVYQNERAPKLVKLYRDGMRRRFYGSEFKVRSSKIRIEGSHADIDLKLLSTVGMLQCALSLEKLGDGWRLSKVHVRPGSIF